jgi:hypothetical protein
MCIVALAGLHSTHRVSAACIGGLKTAALHGRARIPPEHLNLGVPSVVLDAAKALTTSYNLFMLAVCVFALERRPGAVSIGRCDGDWLRTILPNVSATAVSEVGERGALRTV